MTVLLTTGYRFVIMANGNGKFERSGASLSLKTFSMTNRNENV
jgi:hypothetical protein